MVVLNRAVFIFSALSKKLLSINSYSFVRNVSIVVRPKMDEDGILLLTKQLAPPLTNTKHKGQAGRIGVFGGSLEYTGAPYFSAISALKVGADLSHVFCAKDAAPVIKSYSPELIVHPLLDVDEASKKIEPWLDRLHVIVIGPGLGREPSTFKVIEEVITMCKNRIKPLVIDADGLVFVSENPQILQHYPAPVILTPNVMEFARLVGSNEGNKQELARNFVNLGKNITILCKGHEDVIFNAEIAVNVKTGGSGRRCGGQGDLLGGSVATFLGWSLEQLPDPGTARDNRPIVAAFAGCKLARRCNERAFQKKGRSMTCSDMIQEIHDVFEELFELK